MVEEIFFISARMLSMCSTGWHILISTRPKDDKNLTLRFRLEVATGLINCYCSKQWAPNQDGDCLTRRHIWLDHWPTKVEDKCDCVVCMEIQKSKSLPRAEV